MTFIPGAAAFVNALVISGKPAHEFYFGGFLINRTQARKNQLEKLKKFGCTLIFYESCHRILASLKDIGMVFGEQDIVVARELTKKFEEIKNVILEEEQNYQKAIVAGEKVLKGAEKNGTKEISADDAFIMYTTHGLSPTQIRSLGYIFNEQQFAQKMEEHQKLSRAGAGQKFKGGLADHSEKTIMGHTATHLLHKALRDMFGEQLHQTGSNITSVRVRFDFNFDRKLEDSEIAKIEAVVNEKIKENLPVHFEIMPLAKAKEIGAIGLFDEKYAEDVKVYFVGDYSKELCGGPHVTFTGEIKKFKIIKQENIGHGQRRLYAEVG